MNEHSERMRGLRSHGRRIWRWAVFDPPLRIPGQSGCCTRHVLCLQCGGPLGTTNDPVDAFLIAWRHRRQVRAHRL
jgi:hypothetical protein